VQAAVGGRRTKLTCSPSFGLSYTASPGRRSSRGSCRSRRSPRHSVRQERDAQLSLNLDASPAALRAGH
jgi:hypothetical protein